MISIPSPCGRSWSVTLNDDGIRTSVSTALTLSYDTTGQSAGVNDMYMFGLTPFYVRSAMDAFTSHPFPLPSFLESFSVIDILAVLSGIVTALFLGFSIVGCAFSGECLT